MPPGQNGKTIGSKKHYFDKIIGTGETNSVIGIIIRHIAYITFLVTNDTLHIYYVIGVYKILHGADQI